MTGSGRLVPKATTVSTMTGGGNSEFFARAEAAGKGKKSEWKEMEKTAGKALLMKFFFLYGYCIFVLHRIARKN